MYKSITNELSRNRWYWTTIFIAVAVFAIMNWLTPKRDDDILFTFITGSNGERMHTIADVLRSHQTFIVKENGRIANLFAHLFCGLIGKGIFNVCNTIVFALFLHIINILAVGSGRRAIVPVLLSAYILLSFPTPAQTMMWLTGACNYLWAITFTLALWYWLSRNGQQRYGIIGLSVLFVISFIAGNMNEATSFGFFTGMALWLITNHDSRSRTIIVAITGYLLGIALIVSSPGAWERLQGGGIINIHLPFIQAIIHRIYVVTGHSVYHVFPAILILWGLWRWLQIGFKTGVNSILRSPLWCVFIGTTLWMLLFGINNSAPYAFFSTVAFIGVAKEAWHYASLKPQLLHRATVIIALACIYPTTKTFVVLKHFYDWDKAESARILSAPNVAIIEAHDFTDDNRFVMPVCHNSANRFFYDRAFCWYYGKSALQFVSNDVLQLYNSGNMLKGGMEMKSFKSNLPQVADKLYAFPGKDFIVMPVKQPQYVTIDLMDIYATTAKGSNSSNIISYLSGEAEQYPIYGYPLMCGGQCYMVLNTPPNNTTQLIIQLVKVGGKSNKLVFSRLT